MAFVNKILRKGCKLLVALVLVAFGFIINDFMELTELHSHRKFQHVNSNIHLRDIRQKDGFENETESDNFQNINDKSEDKKVAKHTSKDIDKIEENYYRIDTVYKFGGNLSEEIKKLMNKQEERERENNSEDQEEINDREPLQKEDSINSKYPNALSKWRRIMNLCVEKRNKTRWEK